MINYIFITHNWCRC